MCIGFLTSFPVPLLFLPPLRQKVHGRLEQSIFRYGLDELAQTLKHARTDWDWYVHLSLAPYRSTRLQLQSCVSCIEVSAVQQAMPGENAFVELREAIELVALSSREQ